MFKTENIIVIINISELISKKSTFLFVPRQVGKTSYIKNQIIKTEEPALYWTLLDGRLMLKLQTDIGLLRQEVEINHLENCLIIIMK